MTNPPVVAEITTWFINAFGNGHVAHQAYRTHTETGRELLMTYCGRPLPTPFPAPIKYPLCKSCLRAPLANTAPAGDP